MRESFEALMLEKKAKLDKAADEVKQLGGMIEKQQKKSGENEKPQVSPQINFQNSLLRHDFKIIGQVGEVGQMEKLSYISMIRQIEAGLAKGYSENEVVHAVTNAISPGLSIQSYLEGSGQLPLSHLHKIIHSHHKDGSATEIYQQLLVMTQDPKEEMP